MKPRNGPLMRSAVFALFSILMLAAPAAAQDLRALARLDMAASSIADNGGDIDVALALSQPVPYKIYARNAPMRWVVEFNDVAFEADLARLDQSDYVTSVTSNSVASGGSTLVLELSEPMEVTLAALQTSETGGAVVHMQLSPINAEAFASLVGIPSQAPAGSGREAQSGRFVVALDPGHGGVDVGAARDDVSEADLMLTFARELKEALLRGGVDEVVLTRNEDVFVSLPARVSTARAAGADVFLSLHADALAEGRATGTTIYTLSEEASDRASGLLAERQDRQDILAGVDLRAIEDDIATALMDLARLDTAPRTERLADLLVIAMQSRLGKMHKRPRLKAGFSVLKAPDIPSVLVELGFLSSEQDRANLLDPVWRAQAAEGIVDALTEWGLDEAARVQ